MHIMKEELSESRKHDFDTAWKMILEAFEKEIVELLFPKIYKTIDWNEGAESLDTVLQEIQKEIFDKESSQKIISDKVLKVRLKDSTSKILYIHVEVQSYQSLDNEFGERMFRYFYRLWDKFRYEYKDKSQLVASAIYTYRGNAGKDKNFIYKIPQIPGNILTYNFKTLDVENFDYESLADSNPLKNVFIIAKRLLNTKKSDEDIFEAKLELAKRLNDNAKVKTDEQIKALMEFLEYLFLINNKELDNKFKEYKNSLGGVKSMTVEEIVKTRCEEKGVEKGIAKILKKQYEKGYSIEEISQINDIPVDMVEKYLDL